MRVIAGSARSLKLSAPKGLEVRPTTDRIKETLFNIIRDHIYDCCFLDLFCGSGAIGIEALSRGARSAVFADNSRVSCECTRNNLIHTKLDDRAEILCRDAVSAVDRLAVDRKRFDIIFMDPPYGRELEKELLVRSRICDILEDDGFIVIEADRDTDFDYTSECGLTVFREKCYGSNKHIFLKKDILGLCEGSH